MSQTQLKLGNAIRKQRDLKQPIPEDQHMYYVSDGDQNLIADATVQQLADDMARACSKQGFEAQVWKGGELISTYLNGVHS